MSTPAPTRTPEPPVVQIEGLWSVFGQGASAYAVHQDLNLKVQRGEMLSLVGGSPGAPAMCWGLAMRSVICRCS